MEDTSAKNPYRNYSPTALLNEWNIYQRGIDRHVDAVAEAIRKRKPQDNPVGVKHVITALENNLAAMTLIESVVQEILEETRSYKICGWSTGEDKGTVFTYGLAFLDGVVSIASIGMLIGNTNQKNQPTSPWIPFASVVVGAATGIIKDYSWNKLEEYQTDIATLAALVNKDALSYIQGIIKSFESMERINKRLESDRSASENELERELKGVAAFPSHQNFPVDLFVNGVISAKKIEPGSRLHAVTRLLIEKNKREKETVKKEISVLRYNREESEEERRKKLMGLYVQSTCSGYIVDVEGLGNAAIEVRRNLNNAINGIDEESDEEQIDFSALIQLLNDSKAELNDNILYVLDTFLDEESKWLGTTVSKLKARVRSGLHCAVHLVALVVLGLDAYEQNNPDDTSKNLSIAATVTMIASLIFGKWNDWMYRDLVAKKAQRGKLERIREHVERTINRCDKLSSLYADLQELRQTEKLTLHKVESTIAKANEVDRRDRGIAVKCVKTVVAEAEIEKTVFDEGSALAARIEELKRGERKHRKQTVVDVDIEASEESPKIEDLPQLIGEGLNLRAEPSIERTKPKKTVRIRAISAGGEQYPGPPKDRVRAVSGGEEELPVTPKKRKQKPTLVFDPDDEVQSSDEMWDFNIDRLQAMEVRAIRSGSIEMANRSIEPLGSIGTTTSMEPSEFVNRGRSYPPSGYQTQTTEI